MWISILIPRFCSSNRDFTFNWNSFNWDLTVLIYFFLQISLAKTLLDQNADIRRKWQFAVEWLNEEMERGRGQGAAAGSSAYGNWSPPAQSNETMNGYYLERSHSARVTLEKAVELLPEDVSAH